MSVIPINQILEYVNQARTNPHKFAQYIKQDISSFISDKQMPLMPNCYYQVNQSKQTWIQCQKFLLSQEPIFPLQFSESLNAAAEDHATDISQYQNMISHTGTDGSTLSDRIGRRGQGTWYGSIAQNIGADFKVPGRNNALKTVMSLIIDDGVPSRGHRKNLFSTEVKFIGICSKEQGDKIITVMDFLTQDLPLKKLQKNALNKKVQKPSKKEQVPKHYGGTKKFNEMMGGGSNMSQGRRVVSKSTKTSTEKGNGKSVSRTIETIKYSDGTTEEKQTIETTTY